MAVDDLWYLRKKGADGTRIPSQRYGRGKRYRVRWTDPETGRDRTELFDKKSDAERVDANRRADISRGQYVDPKAGRVTLAEHAEAWRLQQLHADSSAAKIESVIRLHILPVLGGSTPIAGIKPSSIRAWVKDRSEVLGPATMHMIYGGVLSPMLGAAVLDRLIGFSPCAGVRLPPIPDTQYYIATPDQVHALYEALPEEHRAVVYVAAGVGWRGGEIFGLELDGINFLRREITVRQQLKVLAKVAPFLGPPKTQKSRRTNELASITAEALARHLERHPPEQVQIEDRTDPRKPVRRPARLVFTREGAAMPRDQWSKIWRPAVAQVGLPRGFGLRDLRHYFATVLIFGGANVKRVQLAMGHTTPTITLNTYVGFWPDAEDQTRLLVDAALGRSCTQVVPGRSFNG